MKFKDEYTKHCETRLVQFIDDLIQHEHMVRANGDTPIQLTNLRRVGFSRVAFEAEDGSTVCVTYEQLKHMLGMYGSHCNGINAQVSAKN